MTMTSHEPGTESPQDPTTESPTAAEPVAAVPARGRRGLVAAVVVAVLLFGWASAASVGLLVERHRHEQDSAELTSRVAERDATLAERTKELERLRGEHAAVQAKLREAEKNAPSAELLKALKDCVGVEPDELRNLPPLALPPGLPPHSGSVVVTRCRTLPIVPR